MRVQREVSLEAHEQVLAVGIDRAHRAPREPLRPAVERVARVRREDLLGNATREHRADARRGVVNRVALGHRPHDGIGNGIDGPAGGEPVARPAHGNRARATARGRSPRVRSLSPAGGGARS